MKRTTTEPLQMLLQKNNAATTTREHDTAYLHRMAKRKPPPNRRSSFVLPNHLRKKKQRIKQPIPGASQPHKPLIDADNARRDETRRDETRAILNGTNGTGPIPTIGASEAEDKRGSAGAYLGGTGAPIRAAPTPERADCPPGPFPPRLACPFAAVAFVGTPAAAGQRSGSARGADEANDQAGGERRR